MDGALVLITLVSLGTTGAVLLYAARLIRDERARSDARVAALAEEITRGIGPSARGPGRAPLAAAPASHRTVAEPRVGGADRGISPDARSARVRVVPDLPGDVPLAAARRPNETSPPLDGRSGGMLFDSGTAAEPTSARWLVPAIGAAVVVLALATIYFVNGSSGGADRDGRVAGPAVQVPLELVSLHHVREGAALTVSGVVRNPERATERREVSAVVFLFGRDGSFLASGRAPLDYQALAAGDESPFAINVPGAGDVSRYRVSFRAGDEVLPHVDRREPAVAPDTAAARP